MHNETDTMQTLTKNCLITGQFWQTKLDKRSDGSQLICKESTDRKLIFIRVENIIQIVYWHSQVGLMY